MGFINETCEEKEKWVGGEGCESQMCSCQEWNNICLNELTFYFGMASRWRWTRQQKKGNTICIYFHATQQTKSND